MNFIKEVINITLRTVYGSSSDWLNPKKVSSRLLSTNDILRENIRIQDNEEPIFEYLSNDNYSLITSKRVISNKKNEYNEIYLKDILEVLVPKRAKLGVNIEDIEPLKKLIIKGKDGEEFLIEFDPHEPTYFASILIKNLYYKLQKNKWYLNPIME